MAATHNMYGPAIENSLKANIGDLASTATEIKVALMDENHLFNEDHDNWGQVATNQVDSGEYEDYTAGGEEILNKQVNYADGVTTFTTTDEELEFTAEGNIKANYAVIYDNTPADNADKKLISCIDFDGAEESVDGHFKLVWHQDGIFRVTVNPT